MQASNYTSAIVMKPIAWSAKYVASERHSNDTSLAVSAVATPGDALDVEPAPESRRINVSLGAGWQSDELQAHDAGQVFVSEHCAEDVLVNRWRAGDRGAGDELVRMCTPLLRSFFRRRATDNVDELMQRTLVACIRAIDRFEGRSSFRSFLLGIAHKQLMMSMRSSRHQQLPLQPEAEGEDNPSQLLSNKEDVRSVAMALNETSPDFRRVLELFYWDDLSVEEIAKLLDLPTGTVKSRLARGRSMIKARLVEAARPGATRETRRPTKLPSTASLLRSRATHERATQSISVQSIQESVNHDSAAIHPSNVSGRRLGSSLCSVHGVGGGRVGADQDRTRLHGQLQECPSAGAIGATG